jgi:hypothetical protein
VPHPEVDELTRNRFLGAWDQHRRVSGYTLPPELPDLLRRALQAHDDLRGLDFDMLVVDEYQDLNACDLRVLRLLADAGASVFAPASTPRTASAVGGCDESRTSATPRAIPAGDAAGSSASPTPSFSTDR